MIKSYQYLDIDINKKTYKRLRAVQGDSKSRYILVSLYDNFKAYNLSNCSVCVFGYKSDKKTFFNYATVTDAVNGKFEIELTNQALAVAGELQIQILILGTNQERLTSFSFYIDVEGSIVDDDIIESANEFKALTGALSQVEEWNGYFEETSGKIEEKYTERLNNVGSQLEHNTSEINAIKQDNLQLDINLSKKRDKEAKITKYDLATDSDANKISLNNLSEEVINAISGNASVSPIIPNESITKEKYAESSVVSYALDKSVFARALQFGTTKTIDTPTTIYNNGTADIPTGKTLNEQHIIDNNCYIQSYFTGAKELEVGKNYNFIIKTNMYDKEKTKTFTFRCRENGVTSNSVNATYLGDGIFAILDYVVSTKGIHQFIAWNTSGNQLTIFETVVSEGSYPIGEGLLELLKPVENSIEDIHLQKNSVTGTKLETSAIAKTLASATNNTITSGYVHHVSPDVENENTTKTLDDEFILPNESYIDVYFNNFEVNEKYNFIIETDIDNEEFSPMCSFYSKKDNIISNKKQSTYLGDGIFAILDYEVLIDAPHQFVIWNKLQENVTVKKVHVAKNKLPLGDILNKEDKVTTLYVSNNGSDLNNGYTMNKALKTFNKALELGATKIYAEAGEYFGQTIKASNLEDLEIKVVKTTPSQNDYEKPCVILNNSNKINELTYNDELKLYTTPFTKSVDSNYNKVFITKELPVKRTGLRSVSYNAILWEVDTNNIANDIKLVPVLTLDECKSKSGSFFYDGSNIYINASQGTIENKEFRYLINEEGNIIELNNINKLVFEDIKVDYASNKGISIIGCNDYTIRHCIANHSCYSGGFYIYNSNGNAYFCKSNKVCSDGFGIAGYGDTNFFNCQGHYNYDDGISHHDRCTGSIIGGEWSYNAKGGVAPAHGCEIDVHNIISHHNGFGMYARADVGSVAIGKTVRHTNNVYYDNEYGISVKNYHVLSYNCKYDNNTKPIDIASDSDMSKTSFVEL